MLSERVEGSIKTGLGHLQDAVGALAGDPALQAKGKFNETAGRVQDLVDKAKDQLSEVMETAMDRSSEPLQRAQSLIGSAFDRNEDRLDDIKSMVMKNPWAAIGVAAVFGIILGLSLKRSAR